MIKRIYLMGFSFVSNDFQEIINEIENQLYRIPGFIPFLITPNADQVLQFDCNTELKEFYQKSYFILPDGFPIVLYSKLIRKPLLKRLTGSDIFPQVWHTIKQKQKSVFIVCPNQQVGELLKTEYPSLRYHVANHLSVEDHTSFVKEANLIIGEINNLSLEYILVGLGFPKQEILSKLIYEKLSQQDKPLVMLLGASFEFYLQLKKRAPVWIQKMGLEWLHRLLQEPKRLWKRYTLGNVKFIIFFVKQLINQKYTQ